MKRSGSGGFGGADQRDISSTPWQPKPRLTAPGDSPPPSDHPRITKAVIKLKSLLPMQKF